MYELTLCDGTNPDAFALGLVERLRRRCERGSSRINAFVKYSRQMEGWFKGEILAIASDMERKGQVQRFAPDRRFDPAASKRNIDLYFEIESSTQIWIELKHWYIGTYNTGHTVNALHYFKDTTSATIPNFVAKLPADWLLPIYMLIVTTPNLGRSDWHAGIEHLRKSGHKRRFTPLTDPNDFPDSYFLGLLKL